MTHTALITGGTRGIGRECTLKLLQNGYNVAAIYKSNDKAASELISEAGSDRLAVIKCDAADYDSVNAVFDSVRKRFGTVDILINNAGIARQSLFCDITREQWDNMMNVNVGSMYNTVHCAYDDMVRNKFGRIVNISSIWGITGASCEVSYSASKAAVIGFTKALAKELGPSGITVNCVAPGVIDTDMNSHLSPEDMEALSEETPLCRIGTVREAASAVMYLISEDAAFITGQVISPNGGIVI